MKKIKVAVFDDNDIHREGLKLLIDAEPKMECVGTFADCSSLMDNIHNCMPNVVLMDIEMPNVSGIEGLLIIRKYFPRIKVIMQTVFENNDKVIACMCAGANGYVLKRHLAGIIEAIIEVNDGGAPMSPSVARHVLDLILPQASKENERVDLSTREVEILKLLSVGHSYKIIAGTLNISYSTVNTHTKHIYEKLKVHSGVDAVMKAIEKRII
ncbi:MAG: response regulator transcription factor [Bacteroidetes bacterium]|nr:response regulator transcription factor [Bacteroidota bacterium]